MSVHDKDNELMFEKYTLKEYNFIDDTDDTDDTPTNDHVTTHVIVNDEKLAEKMITTAEKRLTTKYGDYANKAKYKYSKFPKGYIYISANLDKIGEAVSLLYR